MQALLCSAVNSCADAAWDAQRGSDPDDAQHLSFPPRCNLTRNRTLDVDRREWHVADQIVRSRCCVALSVCLIQPIPAFRGE
jgi:hypothetical protein